MFSRGYHRFTVMMDTACKLEREVMALSVAALSCLLEVVETTRS